MVVYCMILSKKREDGKKRRVHRIGDHRQMIMTLLKRKQIGQEEPGFLV